MAERAENCRVGGSRARTLGDALPSCPHTAVAWSTPCVCSLASEQHAWQCPLWVCRLKAAACACLSSASTHGPFGHSCPVTSVTTGQRHPGVQVTMHIRVPGGESPGSSSAELGKLTQIWATRAGFSVERSTKLRPERCPCHSEEKEGQRMWAA